MAAALTATLDLANTPPRVLLQLTGASGAAATITRYNADGSNYIVRSAMNEPLVGNALTVFDYDSPFGQSATYFATTDGGTNVSAAVAAMWSSGLSRRPWLLHPGIPALSMPITVASRGNRTRPSKKGSNDVFARADPIIVSDGQRGSARFDLMVRTTSLAEENALQAILDDDSVLLLQIGYTTTLRQFSGWVSCGDLEEADVVEWFGTDALHWSMPCTVTSSPVGKLRPQRTYADLLTQFTSYSAVRRAYATYNDLLIDKRA